MHFKSDHLPVLICSKFKYLLHCRKGLQTRLSPWQHLNVCHFVPYLMYITGAKFEYNYSNIFRDILNFVIHYSHFAMFVTSPIFNENSNISGTKEGIPK